ncbi:MAG: hypothetical protein A2V81_04600 [Candidatus Abawacabacteria bacterium RBG_16_42_10]|uniref:Uncharacterized protein n=1 Tax=Candidatus Abawacabacteria bacterium RBG_16_42_10 TaxID=1817814 RepID=A0A1F4XJI3_9BACT|nr:MAG: hypothetical protein A2V81_04600 [Candidatus Abawacabacteria bacterium RBG_16_42_10]
MKTDIVGTLAEEYAHDYLRACDFDVLRRNWFQGKDEIDIIARDLDTNALIFVEVKALQSKRDPLDNFSPHKEHCLSRAIEGYLDRNKLWDDEFRVDVITMNLDRDMCVYDINHYEDVI